MKTTVRDVHLIVCHRCGMPKQQWSGNEGQGIESGAMFYCCKGCADDTGCMCPQ